jgi:hypothetical protein
LVNTADWHLNSCLCLLCPHLIHPGLISKTNFAQTKRKRPVTLNAFVKQQLLLNYAA